MALVDMKSDLAKGVGSKQTPQSFQDGHSATTVTGQKSFGEPPRIIPAPSSLSALSRQSEQLNFKFNDTFNTPSIVTSTKDTLDKYYERAFKSSDPLGARNNDKFGFDEPFVLKAVGDRWGPGGAGAIDFGLVRGGAITQAARTAADIVRLGKFLVTPRGVAFALKQSVLQSMNAGVRERFGVISPILLDENGKPKKPIGNIAGTDLNTGGMKARKNKNMDLSQQFGQLTTPPSVGFVDGSNVRVWSPLSIIESLPIGAHAVRHLEPPGLPLSKLVNNLSNFVTKAFDGLSKLRVETNYGGIRVDASISDSKAAGIFDFIKIPKFTLFENASLTSFFPSLINIPAIPTPNFSGIGKILGGLALELGSLAASAAKGAVGALGGISLPDVSLPKLPNLKIPALPNISIPPIVTNIFSGIGEAAQFILPPLGKFTGSGGLGLGVNITQNPITFNKKNLRAVASDPAKAFGLGELQPLTNLYSTDGTTYTDEITSKESLLKYSRPQTARLGIHPDGISSKNTFPIAVTAGFEVGKKSTALTNQHITQKVAHPQAADNSLVDKTLHTKEESRDKRGARLDKYNLASYGNLNQDAGYGYKQPGQNADFARGIGSQGAPSRITMDKNGNVIKVTGGGGYKNEINDQINLHPYGGVTTDININDTEMDFVPFKFRDMVNGKWIIFRAILESVSDSSSPEYGEESYIGRPDKVYVYKGSTRNVSVTFKVMPKSVQELVTLWEKLNYLRGLTYPKIKSNRMIAPFTSLTVGDMFDKLPVLLNSLNYTIDTASTWDIKPGLRLPKLIQISAEMRVIEPKLPQTTGKFYDLNWLRDDYEYGTFKNDPAGASQRLPDRKESYQDLFNELGMGDLTKEDVVKLVAGENAIAAAKAEVDAAKSNIDTMNKDIPTSLADVAEFRS
jgi:hypothetical protein